MSKILVTGATGFVGKELCRTLIENGHGVVGAVRSPENLSFLAGKMEFKTVIDIGPHTEWSHFLEGVDRIIYLAARVHVMYEASNNPLTEYRKINTEGAEKLAMAAAKKGVRRMVYLSTIKVNGEVNGDKPFTERSVPSPVDFYAQSKWEAEQGLIRIASETGLEVVIIRPPLVYGPSVKANFLRMIEVVERGIPLPLANINNHRSLIYLGNLVDTISTCVTHPKAVGQTYLVSDGKDVSTPELIRRISTALEKPARLFPFPPALMRMAGKLTGKLEAVDKLLGSLVVDSSKIRRELNWSPPYTMEQGLKETAEWYLSVNGKM